MHISYWSSDVCSSDLVLAIAPIIRDGENRLDADFLAGDKVLFTMIGRHVDKARTGVRSDMLGSDEGAGLGEEAPEFVHRMASNRSGQIRAFARPRSEEHTSELQSLMRSSYAVFCLKK